MTLTIRPCYSLKEANEMVSRLHRHHRPVVGHRFSVAVVDEDGVLRGVAIASRPMARMSDDHLTLGVTRCCTDGTPNACSMLYGAVRRAARAMGYQRLLTYILDSGPGTSLKAAGWVNTGEAGGGSWSRAGRERTDERNIGLKTRWECKP